MNRMGFRAAGLFVLWSIAPCAWAQADEAALPGYLGDRGAGIQTSLFGTYVSKGELLVYPFYEYETSDGEEYHPSELGFPGGEDFPGSLETHEFDLFLGYGLTDRLAVEFEAQLYTSADFHKAANDPSAVPRRISESGLGEVESQLRYRWAAETASRPEFFSFAEVAYPFQRDQLIIGVQDWVAELGFGAIKGFSWGTISGRYALAYEDGNLGGGEFALEYLKRLSPRWRVVLALEGEAEDLSLIAEAQLFLSRRMFLKLNSGFGLSSKVPDYAPEVGIMMSFDPARRR
ncbi:MAG: hypothetical protein ACREXP_05095 [Steroidobacteraceae bacterium]